MGTIMSDCSNDVANQPYQSSDFQCIHTLLTRPARLSLACVSRPDLYLSLCLLLLLRIIPLPYRVNEQTENVITKDESEKGECISVVLSSIPPVFFPQSIVRLALIAGCDRGCE